MKKHIIPLSDNTSCVKETCGGKASALACLLNHGFKVPRGFCIGAETYFYFISETGLKERIFDELTRKNYRDMRWEEMWDASLRIRNLFLRTEMPEDLSECISETIKEFFPDKPLAIRSSSLAEDSAEYSFA